MVYAFQVQGISERKGVAEITVEGVEHAVVVQVFSIQNPVAFRAIDLGVVAILVDHVGGVVVGVVSWLSVGNAIQSHIFFKAKHSIGVFVLTVQHSQTAELGIEIFVDISDIYAHGGIGSWRTWMRQHFHQNLQILLLRKIQLVAQILHHPAPAFNVAAFDTEFAGENL